MYYLKLAQVRVPLKNFYAIRAGCAAEGEQIEKKVIIKKADSVCIGRYETMETAEKDFRDKCNLIQELSDGFEVTEYFIEKDGGEKKQNQQYALNTVKGSYLPSEVNAMKKLLEHLGFYFRLSSVIAYERYGFLRRIQCDSGAWKICYQDERQILYIDTETCQIEEETKPDNKNREETDYEQNHFTW